MRTTTLYEWDVEEVNEDGDIIDHNFADSLAEALRYMSNRELAAPNTHELVLVRDVWKGDDLEDRQWSYVTPDGKLPGFRDAYDGKRAAVPKKYLAEMARHREAYLGLLCRRRT